MKRYHPESNRPPISILAWDDDAVDIQIRVESNITIEIAKTSCNLTNLITQQFKEIVKIHDYIKLPAGTYYCGFSSYDLSQFKDC